MNTHKRLLSILHIVYGTASLVLFLTISAVFNSIFPFIEEDLPKEEGSFIAVAIVFSILRIFFVLLAIAVPLPSIIGGIAFINGKKWGIYPMLVSGCVSLLSFPLGTGLGVYSIYTYLELSKKVTDDED